MITREDIYADTSMAGLVKRYSTWPMLHQQTVAEHCWRVATIFVELFGLPSAEVLYYCLHHDSGELWSGDLPYKVKQNYPELGKSMKLVEQAGLDKLKIDLPALTEMERIQVKIADLLEMWETGFREFRMGNQYAEPIWRDTSAEAYKLASQHNMKEFVGQWFSNKEKIR